MLTKSKVTDYLRFVFKTKGFIGFFLRMGMLLRRFDLWEGLWSSVAQPTALEVLMTVPILLGAYLISYFYSGMTVNLVDTHLKGGDADLADAFRSRLSGGDGGRARRARLSVRGAFVCLPARASLATRF